MRTQSKNSVHILLILLIFQLVGCAAQKAYKRGQDAAKREDWDRAVAEYIVALNKDPGNLKYRAGLGRAKIEASQVHFLNAKKYAEAKQWEQAIVEYQLSVDLDPTNQYAANELKKARAEYDKQQNLDFRTKIELAKEAAKKQMPLYKVLGPGAETMIQSLKFHGDSLKNILDSLGTIAGINIVYDSDFRDQEFSVALDNINFRNALEQILVANRLYYKPLDQSTILIIPDNPQKRRQYDEQVIQTFYLSNAELNDVLNLIRSVMQIQRIATNPQLNAITIRDTPDKIAIAQKIIEANDKSRSEILLNVEILEVNRDQAMQYGLDLSTYTVSQELLLNSGEGTAVGQFFGNQIGSIDSAAWRFTVPSILYTALATDQRTRILAKPQIRASEGQQVTVRLGDRVPIPVNIIQTAVAPTPGQNLTTFPTTTFQQQDIGINIDVTPRVHHNREITLTMRFELTSITVPGTGTTPPTIGNRTVNTVIRLKDGETNLLAGLIRRDERKSLRGVPGVTKVPIIKELFAANDKELQEKDIIFTITPHILRIPDITADDLAPIWIGTEDDVRLKSAPPISVFEREKEKTETALETPGGEAEEIPTEKIPEQTQEPVPPAIVPEKELTPSEPQVQEQPEENQPEDENTENPVETNENQIPQQLSAPPHSMVEPVAPQAQQPEPAEQRTTLSLLSPNANPTLGSDIILHVHVENAPGLANVFLFLNFDPSALQVKDISQGVWMTPGAFAKSFDNGRGSLTVNASHEPNAESSGVVATIVLQALKPGKTTMNLGSAMLRDGKDHVFPVTYLPITLDVK